MMVPTGMRSFLAKEFVFNCRRVTAEETYYDHLRSFLYGLDDDPHAWYDILPYWLASATLAEV